MGKLKKMRTAVSYSPRFLLVSILGYFRVLSVLGLYAISERIPLVQVENPLRISWTNPENISHVTGREDAVDTRWIDANTTKGGDWDKHGEEFSEDKWVKSLCNRFEEGVSWTEIEEVRETIRRTENGEVKWHGCRSREDVYDRCERLDAIYENILKQGYKSQAELLGLADPNNITWRHFIWFKSCYDEISVDIARDGTLLFVDGRHRLALATIAGVDRVPVRIVVRHERWQSFRRELLSLIGNWSKHRFLHPDLQDISYKHDSGRWYEAISDDVNTAVDLVLEINGGLSGYFCHRFRERGFTTHAVYNATNLYTFHEDHRDKLPLSHTPHHLRQFSPSLIDRTVAIILTDPMNVPTSQELWRKINETQVDSIYFNASESEIDHVTRSVLNNFPHSQEKRLLDLGENEGLYRLTCRG